MKNLFILVVLVAAVNASLDCQVSDRIPWILTPLSVGSPWSNYTSPNNRCCDVANPNTPIDFDVECHTCLNNTRSTPGFMLDPNNCQKFYMCVPNGDGGFDAHSMTCPDCMFWDDDKLSCIEVDDSCRVSVSVETGSPNPLFTHDPIVSCIDFENADLSTNGMYVFNNGVTIAENGVGDTPAGFCPEGIKCGFFNSSQIEIPFFANNYNHLPNLKITFKMFSELGLMGIISNDCSADVTLNADSFSYVQFFDRSAAVVIDSNDNINPRIVQTPTEQWLDVTLDLDGQNFTLTVNDNTHSESLITPYTGIRESHCPLVIGSLIDSEDTFYYGYIDNICITIDYEK